MAQLAEPGYDGHKPGYGEGYTTGHDGYKPGYGGYGDGYKDSAPEQKAGETQLSAKEQEKNKK